MSNSKFTAWPDSELPYRVRDKTSIDWRPAMVSTRTRTVIEKTVRAVDRKYYFIDQPTNPLFWVFLFEDEALEEYLRIAYKAQWIAVVQSTLRMLANGADTFLSLKTLAAPDTLCEIAFWFENKPIRKSMFEADFALDIRTGKVEKSRFSKAGEYAWIGVTLAEPEDPYERLKDNC